MKEDLDLVVSEVKMRATPDLFESRVAHFSEDRRYRYTLELWWNKDLPLSQFICLNPSTADEVKNDPTVRRCIDFSFNWGYGGFCMTNLFAYRATDPKEMKAQANPIGPENDECIKSVYDRAGICVAAWGNHGSYLNRAAEVRRLLGPMFCLQVNKEGSASHPLYLNKDTIPFLYTDRREFQMWRHQK